MIPFKDTRPERQLDFDWTHTDIGQVEADPQDLGQSGEFAVVVTRSKRSRKTVSARFREGVLHVTIPSWMSAAEESKWVETMVRRSTKANSRTDTDLQERCKQLARQYKLPQANSVVWTRELRSRWGSCTIDTGAIRINGALRNAPPWVVDYVLVHELSHLVHADHSPAFWELVRRYPRSERAIGYLLGRSASDRQPDTPGMQTSQPED